LNCDFFIENLLIIFYWNFLLLRKLGFGEDCRLPYDGLVNIGYDKHFRVHHSKNEFVRGKSHINGIESFWSYAKIRLVKFRGIDKKSFNLHLKEYEFRFNNRGKYLYKLLLEIFRNEPS